MISSLVCLMWCCSRYWCGDRLVVLWKVWYNCCIFRLEVLVRLCRVIGCVKCVLISVMVWV